MAASHVSHGVLQDCKCEQAEACIRSTCSSAHNFSGGSAAGSRYVAGLQAGRFGVMLIWKVWLVPGAAGRNARVLVHGPVQQMMRERHPEGVVGVRRRRWQNHALRCTEIVHGQSASCMSLPKTPQHQRSTRRMSSIQIALDASVQGGPWGQPPCSGRPMGQRSP